MERVRRDELVHETIDPMRPHADDGSVVVRASPATGDAIEVEVTDSGPGIARDERDRVSHSGVRQPNGSRRRLAKRCVSACALVDHRSGRRSARGGRASRHLGGAGSRHRVLTEKRAQTQFEAQLAGSHIALGDVRQYVERRTDIAHRRTRSARRSLRVAEAGAVLWDAQRASRARR